MINHFRSLFLFFRDQFIIILGNHFAGFSSYNSGWKTLSFSWVIILQVCFSIIFVSRSLSFCVNHFGGSKKFGDKSCIYHFAGFVFFQHFAYFHFPGYVYFCQQSLSFCRFGFKPHPVEIQKHKIMGVCNGIVNEPFWLGGRAKVLAHQLIRVGRGGVKIITPNSCYSRGFKKCLRSILFRTRMGFVVFVGYCVRVVCTGFELVLGACQVGTWHTLYTRMALGSVTR